MALKRSPDRRQPRFQIETASPQATAAVASPSPNPSRETGACQGCADDGSSDLLRHGPDCPDIEALCTELRREVETDKEPGDRKRLHRGMALFMTALFLFPILLKSSTAYLGAAGLGLSLFFLFASIGGAIALAAAPKQA